MAADLAILSCIPLQQEEWLAKEHEWPCGDFVRLQRDAGRTTAAAAWRAFANEAGFVRRKLEILHARGARVFLRATADDLKRAAHDTCNIVVLAHWKGPARLPSDPAHAGVDLLETWDRMLPAPEFAELFPAGFSGTVAACMCTSERPAECFRRVHPRAVFFGQRGLALAGLSMLKVDAAFRLMDGCRTPLWQALLTAGDLIDSAPKPRGLR